MSPTAENILLAVLAMQLPVGIAVGTIINRCGRCATPSTLRGRAGPGYDSRDARARRVAERAAERAALDADAEAGRDRREARDARRRAHLIRECVRYGLGRSARHIDDMVL